MASAFEQAALALTAVVTDPAGVLAEEEIQIQCRAPDPESLLVDWLNAVVYEMATRSMLFSEFDVDIYQSRLRARIRGEPVDRDSHQPAVEVKGATFTELQVREQEDGLWLAQCVVDV